ncbi:hotdog fold thioesterase [Periweissella beninensis]|uniref:Hotdog fold thioesterase n=1 Tax=Periweissella beninensis TaxID=504936 RepID=A0ABT0VLF1_9LACO|nr:hotdog fold thioesterase [Periweissella beninensis]MBM7543384.1 uncharacterized protein (TIGR00369 family) [Periweissella beninensis]MCM2437320.1 hotdog fold thioesterase [Periweissella beninensis]MCT4396054.1 hotdog fold thioesterase [Periweissella beninensis]
MNLIDYLGIKVVSQSAQQVELNLPVTENIKQPFGLVHGGINAVLAETAASIAANCAAPRGQVAVGVAITSHHLRPTVNGSLITIATPQHIGTKIQVWDVKIMQQTNAKLVSTSSVTTMFIDQPK